MADTSSRKTGAVLKFRKRPVVISAMRLGRENAAEVAEWVNSHYANANVATMRGGPGGGSRGAIVYIETLEGTHRADVGDWIIRGVHHEFYPCKPDIFEATYEAAPDA